MASMKKKNLSMSPSQGVPPPIDEKPKKKVEECNSSESNSFTDIELITMKTATHALCSQVKEKISEYKQLNDNQLHKQDKVIKEVEHVHEEIDLMKESLGEILMEAHKTKEELKEMREIVEAETLFDEESCEHIQVDPMTDEIKDLMNAINYMNYRLSITEDELKSREAENEILRCTINDIKDSIVGQKVLDKEQKKANCSVCRII